MKALFILLGGLPTSTPTDDIPVYILPVAILVLIGLIYYLVRIYKKIKIRFSEKISE